MLQILCLELILSFQDIEYLRYTSSLRKAKPSFVEDCAWWILLRISSKPDHSVSVR